FKKLVLSYPYQQKKAANFSLLATFKAACQKYPTAFVYVVYSPLCGIWLGASPELLAKKQQSNWLTMALAGTQHTTQLSSWDAKNCQEQQLVNDYIYQRLQPITTDISQSKTFTVASGPLHHLKTEITFKLQPHLGIGDIVKQLHPTPAVCGLPSQAAQQFITQHEGYDRQYYSGFIGLLSPTDTFLYVNLRCLQAL